MYQTPNFGHTRSLLIFKFKTKKQAAMTLPVLKYEKM